MNEKTHTQLLLENLAGASATPQNGNLPEPMVRWADDPRKYYKQYRLLHLERKREYLRLYYPRNRERILARSLMQIDNPETVKRYQQTPAYKQARHAMYVRHSDKIRAKVRAFARSPHGRAYQNGYKRKRRKENPEVKLAEWIRGFINGCFYRADAKKHLTRIELIGCTLPELKAHIESQFEPWMNWGNRRDWHVDHEVPVSAFDLTDPEEQRWAFNWRNLRPLERFANQSKSATLPIPLPSWLPVSIAARILDRVQ
jgi:hypothetical protein